VAAHAAFQRIVAWKTQTKHDREMCHASPEQKCAEHVYMFKLVYLCIYARSRTEKSLFISERCIYMPYYLRLTDIGLFACLKLGTPLAGVFPRRGAAANAGLLTRGRPTANEPNADEERPGPLTDNASSRNPQAQGSYFQGRAYKLGPASGDDN